MMHMAANAPRALTPYIGIPADVLEKMVRGATIGGYDFAEKILMEAIHQGTVMLINDNEQS
jgi:hypothetical protein